MQMNNPWDSSYHPVRTKVMFSTLKRIQKKPSPEGIFQGAPRWHAEPATQGLEAIKSVEKARVCQWWRGTLRRSQLKFPSVCLE